MKTKGLVMEVQKNTVIIMTRDARFLRVPKRGHVEIGEEYSYSSGFSFSSWVAAASVMLLMISSMFTQFLMQPVPAAYVSVDINPSLELTVAQNGKVMAAEALNQEAEVLLEDIRLKGLPVDRAVTKLYDTAAELGYVAEGEPVILLAAVPVDGETELPEKVSKAIAASAQVSDSESSSAAAVALVWTSSELRDKAKAEGVSIGKYAVYLEAQSIGYEVEIASLQTKSIARALREVNVAPADLLKKVEKEKDFVLLAQHVRVLLEQKNIARNTDKATQGDEEETEPEDPAPKPDPVKPDTENKPEKPEKPSVKEPGKPDAEDPQAGEPSKEEPEPEEPVIEEPIILPAENEPILEEARRGFFDWFKDFFIQQ